VLGGGVGQPFSQVGQLRDDLGNIGAILVVTSMTDCKSSGLTRWATSPESASSTGTARETSSNRVELDELELLLDAEAVRGARSEVCLDRRQTEASCSGTGQAAAGIARKKLTTARRALCLCNTRVRRRFYEGGRASGESQGDAGLFCRPFTSAGRC